jgi:hypothetical protein
VAAWAEAAAAASTIEAVMSAMRRMGRDSRKKAPMIVE